MFTNRVSIAELIILLMVSAAYFFMRLIYGALIDLKITEKENNRIYKKIFLKQLTDSYVPFLSAIAFFVGLNLHIGNPPEKVILVLKIVSLLVGVISGVFSFILLRMHYQDLLNKSVARIMEDINELYYFEVTMDREVARRKRWKKLKKGIKYRKMGKIFSFR